MSKDKHVMILESRIDALDSEMSWLIDDLAKTRAALHQIASAGPCVSHPGTERERTCVLCQTFINVARDALGRERWPAESVRDALLAKAIWEFHSLPMGTLVIK